MSVMRPAALRKLRKLLAGLLVGSMLQVGACTEFWGYTLGTTINSLPSLAYQTALGIVLLPAQLGIAALTGGLPGGLGGTGTGGGGGGGNLAGVGGLTNPVSTGGLGGLGI